MRARGSCLCARHGRAILCDSDAGQAQHASANSLGSSSRSSRSEDLAAEQAAVTRLGLRVCTVGEGEAIYIPPQWHHATLNLDAYNVFVSTFTQEPPVAELTLRL